MFHLLDLDAPVPIGLSLLLPQSFENGHRDPKDCNPAEWDGQGVDDVLDVELVRIALQDVDSNLQRGVDKGVNDHTEDAQDNQRTGETSALEAQEHESSG